MTPLRIATLGDFHHYYSYFLYGTMEGAVRCGAWFRPICLFGQPFLNLWEAIEFFKPHIMFCHCIFNKRPPEFRPEIFSILRRARQKFGTKVCYHLGDARKQPRYPCDISDIVDLCLINNSETERYSGIWKVPCYHWPYPCLYQEDIAPPNPAFEAGMVFTGGRVSRWHQKRQIFVDDLKKKVGLKQYPDEKWGNSRFLTADVAASSVAVMGVQLTSKVENYNDVRPFQYIGAGALYFHDKHPSMRVYFEPGKHFVEYEMGNCADIADKYKFYKEHPEESRKIRRAGFNLCQKYHNTKVRVQFVIDVVAGKDVKPLLFLEDIRNVDPGV